MSQKTKTVLWLVPALVVYVVGFVLAAFWDLPIDQAIYSPQNLYAIMMEAFGWYPAFLPTLLLAMIWMTRPRQVGQPWQGWQRAVCGVVMVAGFAVLYYASYNYLNERGLVTGFNHPAAWLWLATGLAFFALLLVPVLRISPSGREKMVFFCLSGSVLMVADQVLIYGLKFIWERTRFDDMLAMGNFDFFTPWYSPLGYGGSSFPSGHVANAACILVLLVLCDLYPRWRKHRNWVTVFCWVFIAAMAFARVLIGRHFLSDTLAASGIIALVFMIMRRTKWYRKALHNTLERAALPPGAEEGLLDEEEHEV